MAGLKRRLAPGILSQKDLLGIVISLAGFLRLVQSFCRIALAQTLQSIWGVGAKAGRPTGCNHSRALAGLPQILVAVIPRFS